MDLIYSKLRATKLFENIGAFWCTSSKSVVRNSNEFSWIVQKKQNFLNKPLKCRKIVQIQFKSSRSQNKLVWVTQDVNFAFQLWQPVNVSLSMSNNEGWFTECDLKPIIQNLKFFLLQNNLNSRNWIRKSENGINSWKKQKTHYFTFFVVLERFHWKHNASKECL